MLVLSRHRNEGIVIGNDITVTVIEIRGDKVRLGIECSRDRNVHRGEVWQAIQSGGPAPRTHFVEYTPPPTTIAPPMPDQTTSG